MAFLTNVNEAIINGHINNLSNRVDNRIIMSDTPPEDLNALWVDIADTAPEFEQISIDTSLTHSLYSADAKVTGDAIAAEKKEREDAFNELNKKNVSQDSEISKKVNSSELAVVAKSGSYNDLSDRPTIPYAYTLPVASANTLGGVKPALKTDEMTQEIGIDADGKLWGMAGGGSGKWITLFEKTLTEEDCNNTNSYVVTKDANGNDFSVHEIIAEVVIPSTAEYSSQGYGGVWSSDGRWSGYGVGWRTVGPSTTLTFQRSVTYVCTTGETGYSIILKTTSDTHQASIGDVFVSSKVHDIAGFEFYTDYTTKYFPAGTSFRVYGR